MCSERPIEVIIVLNIVIVVKNRNIKRRLCCCLDAGQVAALRLLLNSTIE